MARATHLVSRFLGSLRPGGPGKDAEAWVAQQLLPKELELWRQLSGPDRRHAYAATRRVERSLGNEATRAVLAASLLHDIGKTVSGLRTYGRVIATLSAAVAGHETARLWSRGRGFTRKVGLYLQHPKLGSELLAMAGSDRLTVAWAAEHHLPEDQWTVPHEIAVALKAADDD